MPFLRVCVCLTCSWVIRYCKLTYLRGWQPEMFMFNKQLNVFTGKCVYKSTGWEGWRRLVPATSLPSDVLRSSAQHPCKVDYKQLPFKEGNTKHTHTDLQEHDKLVPRLWPWNFKLCHFTYINKIQGFLGHLYLFFKAFCANLKLDYWLVFTVHQHCGGPLRMLTSNSIMKWELTLYLQ